jgi:predicted nucleic acid-binding protein
MVFAYFDTCVWISAFFSKNSNHAKAVEIFEKVKNGDYIVIVTHHILNETLDVLKREAIISTKDEAKAEVLTKNEYQKFSKVLLRLPNVIIKNPNVSTQHVFRPSFSLLFKYVKGMSSSGSCPICHGAFNFVESDTIYEGDALHAMLAWALNCDVFVTFDKDFMKLVKEPLLSPMKIDVLS